MKMSTCATVQLIDAKDHYITNLGLFMGFADSKNILKSYHNQALIIYVCQNEICHNLMNRVKVYWVHCQVRLIISEFGEKVKVNCSFTKSCMWKHLI